MQLSVIIITKNEAHSIQKCLESIKWADEIIILDSGSTDNTLDIGRKYTDKVFVSDWPGFGIQKNRALDKATKDWVLSLDADEVLTPELQNEIKLALMSNHADAYYLTRRSFFCGKLIHFGDWRNDKVLRLFKRESGRFDDAPVHEKLIVNGRIAKLKTTLLHYTADSLDELLDKANRYSSLGALKKCEKGVRSGLLTAIFRGIFAFFRGYLLKGGFLDGKAGFILAVIIAERTYYTYLKTGIK